MFNWLKARLSTLLYECFSLQIIEFLFVYTRGAVLGEDLDASGGVVALAMARNEDRPLALIVHRNSGPLVWDLR